MPERSVETEIVVVGAGIAGLTAASTLAGEGVDVVVLEARDRVGGRVWNTEIGGEANELGGQWVAPYQSAMHALLDDLGISLFPSFRDGEHVYIDPSGNAHRYEGHDAPLGSASEKAFAEAEAKLDALADELDPEAPWAHPDAAELDATTFEAWLRREVADEMAQDLLRSWLAGGFLAKPAHTFSLLQGLWMIAGAGGTYELFEPDQCLAYRVVGGSQLIPIRLAERLGDRVILDAPAREVAWSDGGVEVVSDAASVRARAVIVAVPPNMTNAIRFRPALPAWRQRMGQDLSQGSIIKILAVYETPFWREEGLSGQGFAPYELVRELYDNSPPSATAGVLTTFLAGENAERAGRLSDADRRAVVLEGMAKYVGAGALEPVDFIETDWSAQEWTRGAYGTSFGPGGLTRFGEDLRRSIGPIHWACTDIAGVGHIHMEGAVRSGQRAADSCLAAAPA
ncbi:MAG TPA: FAD-dependent oxidoreductase [Solirubrobacterales bacterium]|nr:FAD-dependent oxidoreductase [Solirubrobacterales bacterium]